MSDIDATCMSQATFELYDMNTKMQNLSKVATSAPKGKKKRVKASMLSYMASFNSTNAN